MQQLVPGFFFKQVHQRLQLLVVFFALGIFVMLRFFIIYILWDGRQIPPEPDDSFTYISAAQTIFEQGNIVPHTISLPRTSSERVKAIPYSVLLTAVGHVTDVSITTLYHIFFYVGILIIAPLLFIFLRYCTGNDFFAALLLVALSLFSGDGGYHGFFWVVPSFFGLIGFFLLFLFLIAPYRYGWFLIILGVPFTFLVHPFGLYTIPFFVVYAIFYSFFSCHFDWKFWKRIIALVLSFFLVQFLFTQFQKIQHIGIGPVANVIEATRTNFQTKKIFHEDAMSQFNLYYLNKIVPHSSNTMIATTPIIATFAHSIFFLLGIFALIFSKHWKLLSFYIAILLVVIVSMISPFGPRLLLYLWPATYLVIGSVVFLFSSSHRKSFAYTGLRVMTVLLFPLLILESTAYGFYVADSFNMKAKMPYNYGILQFLRAETHPGDYILFGDDFSETYIIRGGNLTDRAPILLSVDWKDQRYENEKVLGSIEYLVVTDSTLAQNTLRERLNVFLRVYNQFHLQSRGSTFRTEAVARMKVVYDAGDTFAFGKLKVYKILPSQ